MSNTTYGNTGRKGLDFQLNNGNHQNQFRIETRASAYQTDFPFTNHNHSLVYGHTDSVSNFHCGPFRIPKRRGRPIANNAARERSRVKTLRSAFLELQRTLPAVPPDTKLSKLDVLVLATTYIAHLMSALQDDGDVSHIFAANGCMHPVKKWPMRTRLYAGILSSTLPNSSENVESGQPVMTSYTTWSPETNGI